jgi:glycosyltransferase involved in cell wall biosynthesis
MRILLTVNLAWNILNFRMGIVRALVQAGHDVSVLAPGDGAALEAGGVRHIPLEMDAKGLNPLSGLAMAARMTRHFREERPDVILSWTIKNNIFGAMAAQRIGVPFIPNVSGLGTAFLSGGALQFVAQTLYRRAFRPLDTVFFQNSEDRDLFTDRNLVTPAQAQLLPGSGIDLAHFSPAPIPDTPPVFLMVARLLRDKGVAEFAQAARSVRARHADATFSLLGALDADNRSAIPEALLRAWEAEGIIRYLGTAPDVRPHIAAAHCVVLPSYREGAPRTLIEAAAMARPVIATDVPGCRAVVEDGVTGLLCEARNGNSLAEACMRFLELPAAARTAMARAGRARMESTYDETLVVQAYLAAIDRAVA